MNIKIRCQSRVDGLVDEVLPRGEISVNHTVPSDELEETIGVLVDKVISDLRIRGLNCADPNISFLLTFRREG